MIVMMKGGGVCVSMAHLEGKLLHFIIVTQVYRQVENSNQDLIITAIDTYTQREKRSGSHDWTDSSRREVWRVIRGRHVM